MPSQSGLEIRLRDHLRARSRELARRWLAIIEARLPEHPNRVFPTATLLDHIPQVLERLAEALVADEWQGMIKPLADDLVTLARLRRDQGYSVEELLLEFDDLREVVLEEAAAAADRDPDRPSPRRAIQLARRLEAAIDYVAGLTLRAFRDSRLSDRQERAALLAGFTRAVTHELRNRLNAALLQLEVIRELEDDSTARAEALARLGDVMRHAFAAVEDVSTLGMVEARDPGDAERRLLDEVLEEVVQDLAAVAAERGVEVRIGEVPELPVDAMRMRLVLVNVLGNAIKYCRDDGSDRWVHVACAPDAERGEWNLQVEDNGIGISPELQSRIFEYGFRAPRSGGRDGTGLGLTLAKLAIAQLGGGLELESSPGRGSVFSIRFPAPRAELDPT